MALVLGTLRVAPPVFWALTLPELTALLRGALGLAAEHVPLSRSRLAALMQRFPD